MGACEETTTAADATRARIRDPSNNTAWERTLRATNPAAQHETESTRSRAEEQSEATEESTKRETAAEAAETSTEAAEAAAERLESAETQRQTEYISMGESTSSRS